jgi:hypothetical protein
MNLREVCGEDGRWKKLAAQVQAQKWAELNLQFLLVVYLLHNTYYELVLHTAHKMVWTKVTDVILFEAMPLVSAYNTNMEPSYY